MYKPIATILLVALLISGCAALDDGAEQNITNNKANNSTNSSHSDEDQLPMAAIDPQQTVTDVINLLKDKDLPRLAAYVHPTEGVRFSPYGYVNTETDVIMQASILQNAFEDDSILDWGNYDGSGQSIDLSFADYYKKFIYDHDFVNADQVGYNTIIGTGNTANNATEVYSDSYIAEYHFKGTKANNFMDWSSLRIVLVEHNRDWVVVGIIHDQWTI
ncbi:MAG: hypothetical protein WD424_03170 [Paenibacillaceae bacterium]